MNNSNILKCFKAYDVRGKLGEEINEEVAYRIGRATVRALGIESVVVGFDARESSPSLAQALARGITNEGANVIEIGLSGTEEIYAAVVQFSLGAGIEVTASHNPINYNGMKIVKEGSKPLSQHEFRQIKSLAEKNNFPFYPGRGAVFNRRAEAREAYLKKEFTWFF